MRYSVYGFLSFAKNMSKNIDKYIYIYINLSGKYNRKILDHAKKSAADVKSLQKMSFKKQQKQLMMLLVKKLLIKSQGFQKM